MKKGTITDALKTAVDEQSLNQVADQYNSYHATTSSATELRMTKVQDMTDKFYDLVTDHYEYGWGDCFHFSPRFKDESFMESLRRYEYFIALHCNMMPNSRVLDAGCGIGGPARNIARFTGSQIVGININEKQLKKAESYTKNERLDQLVSFEKMDYHQLKFPNESFDGAYAIEATVHSSDKEKVFGEIFRVLKPGSTFAAYEWCLTDAFDPSNAQHQTIKKTIEAGNALPDIWHFDRITQAMKNVGFKDVQCQDLDADPRFDYPWYRALAAEDVSLRSFSRTPPGRAFIKAFTAFMEISRLAPKGTIKVTQILTSTADALVESGRLKIFTPVLFFKGKKP